MDKNRDIVSLVINVDSRSGFLDALRDSPSDGNGSGVRSADFFTHGVLNKRAFFEGYKLETILYIDMHEDLPEELWKRIMEMNRHGIINKLIISKHDTRYLEGDYHPKWLDLAILNAIFNSVGKYIIHTDADTMLYQRKGFDAVRLFISWLDSGKYDFVSYPSHYSPAPITDKDFEGQYWWASTRFFICKRESLDYTEIVKCLMSAEYLYKKYGEKNRRCPWLEHILGIIAGKDRVFYPPSDINQYLIFCWKTYHNGLIKKLSQMSYDDVRNYVIACGGIKYPNDVVARNI